MLRVLFLSCFFVLFVSVCHLYGYPFVFYLVSLFCIFKFQKMLVHGFSKNDNILDPHIEVIL